ncbi:MAG: YafY family protein [Pseudomonadota bacterium]
MTRRADRLFETIQILRRAARPLTARAIAEALEVSPRTVYRDIAALEAMQVPVEGAAGLGYVLRPGYDLPPLNFDTEEVEALTVGLAMLARTGDRALQRAAMRVRLKIEALAGQGVGLHVAPWGAPADDPGLGCVSIGALREAIRAERKLLLTYRDDTGRESRRIVRPVAVVYHIDAVLLAAWCELRRGFRHFRTDRIWACEGAAGHFVGQGARLRAAWSEAEGLSASAAR